MKQIWVRKPGSAEVMQIHEIPDPIPRSGEVRIRVEAIGVNFADILGRMGRYREAKPPFVPGYEVSGKIDSVGQGVPDLKEGDPVLALTHLGGYCDVLCVPHKQVFRRSPWMNSADGAALAVNYLTAYLALVVMGSLKQGDKVLIHRAAGGVGLAAVDLSRMIGADIFGTASPSKHEFLLERGLHHPIDYRNFDYERVVNDLTAGRGVQLILDPLGGVHWRKNYRLLMPTGRLICYGLNTLATGRGWLHWLKVLIHLPFYNPVKLINDNKAVLGVQLDHLWTIVDLLRPWMAQIINWYDEALFRPKIDRTFALYQAAQAHIYIQERKNIGKVLLIP